MKARSVWNWRGKPTEGIWAVGPVWLKPLAKAAPWLTVLLLLMMLHLIGGTMTAAEGVLFDLPESALTEGEATQLVALVMPMRHQTLVFFDDARYTLDNGVSFAALGDHLADRAAKVEKKTLLILADRRVASWELMKIAAQARQSGLKRILFANRKQSESLAE